MPDDVVDPSCVARSRWLFGKLPSLGDFVSRGIATEDREALDHWLSAEMQAARRGRGDGFDEAWDHAPAWTFVEHAVDGGWCGGALCASMDRVGRRYPLVMAAGATDGAEAAGMALGCLDAMCRAFAEGWDVDRLQTEPLEASSAPWQPSGSEWALLAEDGPVIVLAGTRPQGVVTRMLELAP